MSNRLANEQSRYLLQHAENPVDWWSWGDEAFSESRRTGKPIFVSIGYSSCHWCHVLAHESFEDEETANVINEHFVPIKVDKEEYPDIDGYYMSFLTQLSGSGGWPLNVLLNSNLAPFYAFTYLSADSLRSTLVYAKNEYEKHEKIREQTIHTTFTHHLVDADHLTSKIADLRLESPGTATGPQFPQALYLALALDYDKKEMVREELIHLITKGLFDHIEGGWFRYSVDPNWKVPHFEKMLYDQAALLYLCAKAHEIEPALCEYAMGKTVSWLKRHMRLANRLYGSATDADTTQGEGTYYTIEAIESQLETELFRLAECGVHEDRYQPWLDMRVMQSHPEKTAEIVSSKLSRRNENETPGLDSKTVFSWNAFLGYALYECYRATGDESLRETADDLVGAIEDLLKNKSPDDIPHVVYESGTVRGNRYLQDYAAYLLLLEAIPDRNESIEQRRTELYRAIQTIFVHDERIWHTDKRMFESQSLWQDTPFPSGGSILLNAFGGEDSVQPELESLLNTNIVDVASSHPMFFSYWLKGYRTRRRVD
jgi:uncharacterized protein